MIFFCEKYANVNVRVAACVRIDVLGCDLASEKSMNVNVRVAACVRIDV